MNDLHIYKGSFIDTPLKNSFRINSDHVIVTEKGIIRELLPVLPEKYKNAPVTDFGSAAVIPSLIDLHVHAPQDMQTGLGMDLELIDWLNTYTFPFESRYADRGYAEKMHPAFVQALYDNGSLRSVILGTIHDESNRILMELLEQKGLKAYVGKMNMDRNAPPELIQETAVSLKETEKFCRDYSGNPNVKPVITPRFVPSCTSALMKGLSDIACSYGLPVQSHLSENRGEIRWVKQLYPESSSYAGVYDEHGLFGRTPTLMAHGIHLEEEEIDMCRNSDVRLVHCPAANLNLRSGIMPLTAYLDKGLKLGLGSDVGAGHIPAMNRMIVQAVQSSKILSLYHPENRGLSLSEAFHLATKANGEFWGNTGSFEAGNYFDALVITDPLKEKGGLSAMNSIERFLYRGDDRWITQRYLEGKKI